MNKRVDIQESVKKEENFIQAETQVANLESAELDKNLASENISYFNKKQKYNNTEANIIANNPKHNPKDTSLNNDNIVNIQVRELVKCKIGPKFYLFEPDKIYKVPEYVKKVLQRSNKLTVI